MKDAASRIADFNSRFGTEIPVVGAPMEGVTTPALAAAVSGAGGLGVLAGDFLSPEELAAEIDAVRELTDRPFAVNLRVPPRAPVDAAAVAAMREALSGLMEDLGCADAPVPGLPDFDGQFEVLLEKDVPAVRVCFGGFREACAEKLEERGIPVLGAACTLREAKVQCSAGAAAVVLQGVEAGGPRLCFEDDDASAQVGLLSLIGPAARATGLPVIASGGIMTGPQMAAALAAGASAVEVGTLVAATDESGSHPLHREALALTRDAATVLTRVFSGRLTRVAPNGIIDAFREAGIKPLSWPAQQLAMDPVLRAARRLGRDDLMELSAGQGAELAARGPCGPAVRRLARECARVLGLNFN